MASFEYDAKNGMQYGNGGRESAVNPDGSLKDNLGQLPLSKTTGSLKPQVINDFLKRKALLDVVKEQVFQPLATVTNLAPNNGKYIKQYVWHPLLDDRNINDQGIDATGATVENGNLYGSSKDISTIAEKLPSLHETGGKYNRVGFHRTIVEGTIANLGFYFEFTKDQIQFDSDPELFTNFTREALRGANEIVEDALQLDLINGAGVVYYCGGGTQDNTMNESCELTYKDLIKLSKELANNHVPTHYKMFTGSNNIDTRTVSGGWTIYCGPEMRETFMAMKDLHDRPAFIPVEQYAAGADTVKGEVGRVYKFRIVEVEEMTHWEGVGATASDSTTYENNGTNYNVYPLLIIGDESFTSIGFRTDGKTHKFDIIRKMPGEATATREDPYGRTGFWSIQWWYGTMILRPERLFLIKSVARC